MTINDLLQSIEKDRLYGELLIKYEAGKIVVIKKTESIKPSAMKNYDIPTLSSDIPYSEELRKGTKSIKLSK